jgi:hypothetical protein
MITLNFIDLSDELPPLPQEDIHVSSAARSRPVQVKEENPPPPIGEEKKSEKPSSDATSKVNKKSKLRFLKIPFMPFVFLYSVITNLPLLLFIGYIFVLTLAVGYAYSFDVLVKYVPIDFLYASWSLIVLWVPKRLFRASDTTLFILSILNAGSTYMLNHNTDGYIRNLDTLQGNAVWLAEYFKTLQRVSGDPEMTPLHMGVSLHKVTYACTHRNEFVYDQCKEELKNGLRMSDVFFDTLTAMTENHKLYKPEFTAYVNMTKFTLNSLHQKKLERHSNPLEYREELVVVGVSRLIIGQVYERNISHAGRAMDQADQWTHYIYDATSVFQALHVVFGHKFPKLGKLVAVRSVYDLVKQYGGGVCVFGMCMDQGLYYLDVIVPQVVVLKSDCLHRFCYIGGVESGQYIADNSTILDQCKGGKVVNTTFLCNNTLDFCIAHYPLKLKDDWTSAAMHYSEIAFNTAFTTSATVLGLMKARAGLGGN